MWEYLWHSCEWMHEWEKEWMISTSFLHATPWGPFLEGLSEARVTNCGFVGLTSCSPGDTMRAGLRSWSTGQLWAGIKGPHVKCVQRAGRNGTDQHQHCCFHLLWTWLTPSCVPTISLPCVLPWRTWISKPLVGPILEHSKGVSFSLFQRVQLEFAVIQALNHQS